MTSGSVRRTARMVTRPAASRDTTSGPTGAGGPSIEDASCANARDGVATPASQRISGTDRKGLPIRRIREAQNTMRTDIYFGPAYGHNSAARAHINEGPSRGLRA